MSVDKCKIHFNPDNLEIVVDRGTNLLSAALAAGVHISASCNSMGVCGYLQGQDRKRFRKKHPH